MDNIRYDFLVSINDTMFLDTVEGSNPREALIEASDYWKGAQFIQFRGIHRAKDYSQISPVKNGAGSFRKN